MRSLGKLLAEETHLRMIDLPIDLGHQFGEFDNTVSFAGQQDIGSGGEGCAGPETSLEALPLGHAAL